MKKTIEEIVNEYKPKLPTKWAAFKVRFLLFILTRFKHIKYTYHFDKKEMKNKQVILISDHACRESFFFTIHGYRFSDPNLVVGYQNMFNKALLKTFMQAGVIPKYLYTPDFKTTKSMLRLIKDGASICFFPEGIQSTHGATQPMNPATIKFFKMAKTDVVLCSSHGAYLSKPRYSKKFRRGRIEIDYKVLFTKDQINEMSEDELYEIYKKEFAYNDFAWNKEKQYKYKASTSNATGLNKILYKCPNCGKEFSLSIINDTIKCENCGNEIRVDECYNLSANNNESKVLIDRIDLWYNYQRKEVKKEIMNPDFKIEFDCNLVELNKIDFKSPHHYVTGRGHITINHEGTHYIGSRNNEPFNLFIEIMKTPSAPFTPGIGLDYYLGSELYSFEPINECDKKKVVKWMIAIEEMHNLIDESWNKVSLDVYNY